MVRPAAIACLLAACVAPAAAGATVSEAAPAFTATDSDGHRVSLAALRGRTLVLEWTNDGCPFLGKWRRSGSMQRLQREATGRGAVWLSVISSAPGEQGFADGARANRLTAARSAAPSHVLLDPAGTLGHLYGATTTPDMVVISPVGTLAYSGGADSIGSTDVADLARAEPYAREAIAAVLDGKPVPHPVTRPYGCSLNYAG